MNCIKTKSLSLYLSEVFNVKTKKLKLTPVDLWSFFNLWPCVCFGKADCVNKLVRDNLK